MNRPPAKVYLTVEHHRGTPAWRHRRRRTVMAGTIVALFVGAMCLIGTDWAFAASIGAVLGAQHWDRHRRPDRDEIDVIACMLGFYVVAVCVAAVAGVAFFTAFALLD